MKKIIISALFSILVSGPVFAQDEEPTPACRATPEAKALDFWAGDYEVVSNNDEAEPYGTNLIEATLDGCAIIENWTSRMGGQGKSLFYFDALANTWTQVWVTTDTSKPWGLKIKKLVGIYDNGAVRFQSQQSLGDGKSYLDRTTLTPLEDGSFIQLIEISEDGGNTWKATFDAIYRPRSE